jgi:hypothetical protein
MLKIHQRQTLAIELLRRNARISIVHKVTGISRRILTDTYFQLHGRIASSGAMKQSTQAITRNLTAFKEAIFFVVCYQTTESLVNEAETQKIIVAFDMFKKLAPYSKLDFSGAWVIADEFRQQKITLIRCTRCQAAILLNARLDPVHYCMYCKGSLKRFLHTDLSV